ncbi:von Willebrand factor type A [Rhizobium sp. CF080]|uniref:vWA domain-containing protein n=1 Tax=Rhizobium sp. (strain CF080) TaxID=1144310 RepID=UPI000271C665|nr:TadE/TadG family type IV pilus assembly protein [Rhizobium sp. CF080]EUB97077.1 von Willebrand factor type A [Rhizobium sp. CF080]
MRHTLLRRLAKDRAGNFGIMTAIMLPVLLAVGGVAVDLTHVMEEKNKLQALADSATLAAAAAMADKGTMTVEEAQTLAKSFVLGPKKDDIRNSGLPIDQQEAAIAKLEKDTAAVATISTTSNTAASYEVSMTSAYDVPLTGLTSLLGFTAMRVGVESKSASGREGNALSMYLALDESGSMAWDTTTVDPTNPTKPETYDCGTKKKPKTCTRDVPNYLSKMLSLKTAAAVMFDELKKADPNSELIRVGADSYDDKTKTEQSIQWGTTAAASYVNNLPAVPDGGTDASGAMTNAYNALKAANATEKTAHDGKHNTSFERFIVLMTDGEMTGNSSSWNQTLDTKVRTECQTAKADGIKIYTIAFMAPDKGKSLLEYCSSGKDEYYYEPDDMTTLVESFGEIARKAAKTGTRLTN